jgi:RNA polymerase sigma-70 factor (ECF subfamily)
MLRREVRRMERDLVLRAIAGDHDAFTEIARRSDDRSFALARLILRDEHQAQDATQDAYIAAWRDLSSLRDPDRFEAWLHRLLVRACYRAARRERRLRLVEIRELELDPPVARPIGLEDRDELERAFRRLDPEQRTVLVLHHYVGLTLPEAAEAMAVPVGTAKSRLHRASRAMRAAIEADRRSPLVPEGRTV